MTILEPLDVCARIVAYNHPLMFIAVKLAAPISAGNVVVMKPLEQALHSSYRPAELADDLFPPGIINIVSGTAECESALVSHPRTAVVTPIGSVPTGRAVERGAVDCIKVLLELGGKNALIVYPDVDVDHAIRGIVQR